LGTPPYRQLDGDAGKCFAHAASSRDCVNNDVFNPSAHSGRNAEEDEREGADDASTGGEITRDEDRGAWRRNDLSQCLRRRGPADDESWGSRRTNAATRSGVAAEALVTSIGGLRSVMSPFI